MSIYRRRRTGFQFRSVEALESRQLLAGHGLAAFSRLASSAPVAQQASFISSVIAGARSAAHDGFFAALAAHSHRGESQGTTLSATLTDPNSSATGNVTYKTAYALRAAARVVPHDLLLAETDSPYLAPQPVRGKRNEPAFVTHTYDVLAQLHGEEIRGQIVANAERVFGL